MGRDDGEAKRGVRFRRACALSYTLLRVNMRGVVLWRAHGDRLGLDAGSDRARELHAELMHRGPGVYAVRADPNGLHVQPRANRTWSVAEPWTCADSPILGRKGLFHKGDVTDLYEPIRCDPTRKLAAEVLCVGGGFREVYESARASVFAWDGACVWAPPASAPRVRSVSEIALRRAFDVRERPLGTDGASGALFLLNAVRGPGRLADFDVPEHVFAAIRTAMEELTE